MEDFLVRLLVIIFAGLTYILWNGEVRDEYGRRIKTMGWHDV